jgi:hypothetical protein
MLLISTAPSRVARSQPGAYRPVSEAKTSSPLAQDGLGRERLPDPVFVLLIYPFRQMPDHITQGKGYV